MEELNFPATTSSCPYCDKPFKRVGNNLPHCKKRKGRDYSQFRAPKTLRKKASKPGKKLTTCSTCHKAFLRLSTHLRNSATCRIISPLSMSTLITESPPPSLPPQCPSRAIQNVTPQESAHDQSPNSCHSDTNSTRPPMKLPKSNEEWMKVNHFFETILVPAVIAISSSPEEKNSILANMVYMTTLSPGMEQRKLSRGGQGGHLPTKWP